MASVECQQKEDSCEGKRRSTLFEESRMTISENGCKANSQNDKRRREATSREEIKEQRGLGQLWRREGIG